MLQMLQDNWKAITLIGAILTAGSAGGVWADGIMKQVAANTQDRMIRQYQTMELRRRSRPLNRLEWQMHCSAGRYLGIFKHCPPPGLNPRRRMRPPSPAPRRRH